MRLLDCFGFTPPACFLAVLAAFGVVVDLRFVDGGGGGFGGGFITGEFKKADGDGMVIVSISGSDTIQPLANPATAIL